MNKEYRFGPASLYKHNHPEVTNTNEQFETQRDLGQRFSDGLTAFLGSWPYLIIQTAIFALWIAVNLYLAVSFTTEPKNWSAWDPYPFILLNLVLSFQAAYTGPIVMISQNRQALRDRIAADEDYIINKKTEEEIRVLMEQMAHQDKLINELLHEVQRLNATKTKQEDLVEPPAF